MLEARDISYQIGLKSLLDSLTFSLDKGEKMAIRGPNGSGKTTLLRLIAGLIQPVSGQFLWDKEKIDSDYQQNLLYIGHKLALFPEGLVKDHLYLWEKLYGIPRQNIKLSFELWGLGSFLNQKVSHLSQGQQKRLSLSRCSWLKRPLWLLDEPHAALDSTARKVLNQVIAEHLKSQGMVILSTHGDISSTKEICL